MYKPTSRIVYGFHGCDISTKNRILHENGFFRKSNNRYDWLGSGVYFWECDPQRAMEFAESVIANNKQSKGSINTPAVIGAIIDLGNCLDLANRKNVELLAQANKLYLNLVGGEEKAAKNRGALPNMKGRFRDCVVINLLNTIIDLDDKNSSFDTVRATFMEGEPIYPTSAFYTFTHTQICVRNLNCIKAVFDPRKPDRNYPIP